jgi:O-antigen ligase
MLSQAYVCFELNLSYYSGYNQLVESGFGGMDNNCNAIAAVTGCGLAFFLACFEKNLWLRMLAAGSLAVMAHIPLIGMSRGGMLGLVMVGAVTFFIIPRTPKHYLALAMALLFVVRMAGPEVQQRFVTVFTDREQRDESAQSRLDMWGACWQLMQEQPLLGVGPRHWPLNGPRFGWPLGKEAHSLWFQTGAELGFPGVGALLAFYALTVWRLRHLALARDDVDPRYTMFARMVIASISGFVVSASFVSLEGLEIPYYVALIGASTLNLAHHGEALAEDDPALDTAAGLVPALRGDSSALPTSG